MKPTRIIQSFLPQRLVQQWELMQSILGIHSPGLNDGFISKPMANFGPIRMKLRTITMVVEFLFLPSLPSLSLLRSLMMHVAVLAVSCNHEVNQT